MSAARVAVVVVNWNRSADTVRAVESCLATGYEPLEVVLVDNGSSPVERSALQALEGKVAALWLSANHGYARAANAGAALAISRGAEHVLFLNNDAALAPGDGVLGALVGALEERPELGLVGPCIVNGDALRRVQSRGFRLSPLVPLPLAPDRGKPTVGAPPLPERRIDYLMGCCVLARGSALAAVNGFDDDYFFFGDDVDLAYRMRARGYESAVLRDRFVVHGKSSTVKEGSANYAYTAVRGNLIFVEKHATWWQRPFGYAVLALASLLLTFRSATSLRGAGIAPVLRGWRDFLTGRWGGFDGRWPEGYEPVDLPKLWNDARALREGSRGMVAR